MAGEDKAPVDDDKRNAFKALINEILDEREAAREKKRTEDKEKSKRTSLFDGLFGS